MYPHVVLGHCGGGDHRDFGVQFNQFFGHGVMANLNGINHAIPLLVGYRLPIANRSAPSRAAVVETDHALMALFNLSVSMDSIVIHDNLLCSLPRTTGSTQHYSAHVPSQPPGLVIQRTNLIAIESLCACVFVQAQHNPLND